MSLQELDGHDKVVGLKQVKKALNMGKVKKVYIAVDAEPHISMPLLQLCGDKGVETEQVESMKALGRAAGIEVGSAAVALLK